MADPVQVPPKQNPESPAPAGQKAAQVTQEAKQVFNALPRFEQLAAVGGLVYLIGSFLPVYSSKVIEMFGYKSPSISANLWDFDGLWVILAVLVMVVGLGVPFLNKFAPAIKLPLPKPMLYLAAGVVGALIPILQWMSLDGKDYFKISFGFFTLIVGGVLIAIGGFQAGGAKMYQERINKMRQAPPQE